MTLIKIVPKDNVKWDTDPLLLLLVKCVLNFNVNHVMKIKIYVPNASMDLDFGLLPLQE